MDGGISEIEHCEDSWQLGYISVNREVHGCVQQAGNVGLREALWWYAVGKDWLKQRVRPESERLWQCRTFWRRNEGDEAPEDAGFRVKNRLDMRCRETGASGKIPSWSNDGGFRGAENRHLTALLVIGLGLLLLPMGESTSISEIKSGVPVQGSFARGGGQHLYYINVTRFADIHRLAVLLKPSEGASRASFSLSLCPGRLPCGKGQQCGCPTQWVDDGTR